MVAQFPELIRVVFSEYGGHVSYATRLAEQLEVPLVVYLPISQCAIATAGQLLGNSLDDLKVEMSGRVERAVRKHIVNPARSYIPIFTALPTGVPPERNDILVSPDMSIRRNEHVLSSGDEYEVFRGDRGPILIPLGDGDGSTFAAEVGVKLAKRLGTGVIFWHTTWRDQNEQSTDPRKHVCRAARTVITVAERHAREAGVGSEDCRVECADTVVEGIIRTALYSGASLVVMARGKRKRFGAYADRVRDRKCPVPLLILDQAPAASKDSVTAQGET